MPYPRRLLNEGEEIVLDLKPHWWYFSKHILTGIPLVVLFVLLWELHGDVRRVAGWLYAGLAIAWAGWLGLKYLQWYFTHFVVTTDRTIFRTGVLAKHGREIPLERINDITFNQGIFERIIGAGTLLIESAGERGQSEFTDVRHPDGVQQEIYRQMEANAQRRARYHHPPVPAPAPEASPAPAGGRRRSPSRSSSSPVCATRG
ncbi:MAG: PH domain-containing protein [Acidimicrobiia bacterium]|nr:PH domain-containing protein [Acidimicrobiia bacterium]